MGEARETGAPPGARKGVYLYADYRPEELRTLIYLCNGTEERLCESTFKIDVTTLFEFVTCEDDDGIDWSGLEQEQIAAMHPGQCVLVNELSHEMWDLVYRYELMFSEGDLRHEKIVAYDRALNAWWLAENPTAVWVIFCPTPGNHKD